MYAAGVIKHMAPDLHVVAELPQFLRDVAAVGMSQTEHQAIINTTQQISGRAMKSAALAAFARSALPDAAREKVEVTEW
jgi:hypothetical protein